MSKLQKDVKTQGHNGEASNEVDGADSLWSHLKYGLGMLVFLVGPSFIPGITSQQLIMGYGAILMIIFGGVGLWAIVRGLRNPDRHR